MNFYSVSYMDKFEGRQITKHYTSSEKAMKEVRQLQLDNTVADQSLVVRWHRAKTNTMNILIALDAAYQYNGAEHYPGDQGIYWSERMKHAIPLDNL